MTMETLILHGSGFIVWDDASGLKGSARRHVSPRALTVRLSQAPADLQLIHKSSGTALWRRNTEDLCRVVPGAATPADLEPPAKVSLSVAGVVSDPAGHFLPRRFAFDAEQPVERRFGLFRSPLGTRFSAAGGLYGRTVLEDGSPLPWALLQLRVMPPLTEPLEFLAQSDGHGEFRLALDGLPALTKDAPSDAYDAQLSLFPAPDDRSPDLLPAVPVAGSEPAVAELPDGVAPGRVATLVPGRETVVLRYS